jgi:hypothetical protein
VVTRGAEARGRSDVYDLAVEGQPEYFANGILVHNSARNGIFAYKEIETLIPQSYFVAERMEEIQQEYEKELGERVTDPTRLWMMQQTQMATYGKKHAGKSMSFNLPSNRNIRNNRGVQ